jgi:hypothetical protein
VKRNEGQSESITDAATAGRAGLMFARALEACVMAAAALGLASSALAATYKWIDDKGVVHYTDKIPPEAMNRGNVELDKQGIAIKRNEPPLTPEQRKALAEEAARQEQIAKDRELIDRRDRALLATYTTEGEIDLARKRAVTTIEAQIDSSSAYSATLNKRKAQVDAQKAALGDKPLPLALENELASINSELAKQADLIATKRKEIVAVNARYDADRKRWSELRAATAAMSGGTNVRPTAARQ